MRETEVITTEVRFNFPSLFVPRSINGSDPKFSVTCLLPKTDVAGKSALDAAIAAAIKQGSEKKWSGIVPPIVPTPIHDGDGVKQDGTAYGPECKGHWVFTASCSGSHPPEVVSAQGQRITDQSEIYSGCYGRVLINAFPYMSTGKKGVGFGLGPVQKLRDGESLGAVS